MTIRITIITIWTTAIGYQIHPSDDNLDNPLALTFCPSHPHRPKHHKQTSQFLYLGSIYMLICEYFPSRRSDPVGMDISILTMIYVSCFLPYQRPSHHHRHPPPTTAPQQYRRWTMLYLLRRMENPSLGNEQLYYYSGSSTTVIGNLSRGYQFPFVGGWCGLGLVPRK